MAKPSESHFDDVVGERVDKLFTPPFDLLLGRRISQRPA